MLGQLSKRDFSITDVIQMGWEIYCKRFKVIIGIIGIGAVPGGIANYLIVNDPRGLQVSTGILLLVNIVLMAIAYMAVVVLVDATVNQNKEIDWRTAVQKSYSQLGNCIGTSLLAGIIVLGLSLLLLIPGIIWSMYYTFLLQVIILHGLSGKTALNYSKSLVKGRWWRIFMRVFILGVIVAVPSMILSGVLSVVPHGLKEFISIIINLLAMGFHVVGMTIIFLNLDSTRQTF